MYIVKKKEKGTWLVDFLARKTNKAVENGSAVKNKISENLQLRIITNRLALAAYF